MLVAAGFVDVKIAVKENGRDIVKDWIPGSGAENYVTSAYVTATKPRQAHGFRDGVFYGASAACCAPSAWPRRRARRRRARISGGGHSRGAASG